MQYHHVLPSNTLHMYISRQLCISSYWEQPAQHWSHLLPWCQDPKIFSHFCLIGMTFMSYNANQNSHLSLCQVDTKMKETAIYTLITFKVGNRLLFCCHVLYIYVIASWHLLHFEGWGVKIQPVICSLVVYIDKNMTKMSNMTTKMYCCPIYSNV